MAQRHFCFAATRFFTRGEMYGRLPADERLLLSRLSRFPMLAFTGVATGESTSGSNKC